MRMFDKDFSSLRLTNRILNSAKTKTVHAHFDGKVLRPDEPVDLKPNVRYRITIKDEDSSAKQSIWEVLSEYSGKIDGPED